MFQTGITGNLFIMLLFMVAWGVCSFLFDGEHVSMTWTTMETFQVCQDKSDVFKPLFYGCCEM